MSTTDTFFERAAKLLKRVESLLVSVISEPEGDSSNANRRQLMPKHMSENLHKLEKLKVFA